MPDLFADTSGWGNLVDATQPYHSLSDIFWQIPAAPELCSLELAQIRNKPLTLLMEELGIEPPEYA
jgi:hypothetical protein